MREFALTGPAPGRDLTRERMFVDNDPHIVPTSIAAVVIALTVAFVVVQQVRTRPRRPVASVATIDLGPEPPAIVDLLTDDFTVTPEAVPATLVDLAARRWLSIEDVAGGNVIIRVRGRDRDEPLAPYERRVLDHVRELAIDGVVPAAAMTTGPESASRRWWRSFRREVIADAQARGLCRDRWTRAALVPIWAGVIVSGVLIWAAAELRDGVDEIELSTRAGALWVLVLLATAAVGVWVATLAGRDLQRDTDEGLAAAGRWVGTRRYMAGVGQFEDKPAAMVALWDRYLAHAVALDLAPLVVAQLPLGAEDHRHAWSRASGNWRHVRVRYPRLRPGYGQHPVVALLGAAVAGSIAGAVLVFVRRIELDDVELLDDQPGSVIGWIDFAIVVIGIAALVVLCWNVVKLCFAVLDLFVTDQRRGVAIRTRVREGWFGLSAERSSSSEDRPKERFFCAVDTGEHPVVAAWRVRQRIFGQIRQGERYAFDVTPRLKYVRRVAPDDRRE